MVLRKVVRRILLTLPRPLKKMVFFGRRYYCPVCQSRVRRFWTYGRVPRSRAWCPVCGALERHRLVWMFLQTGTDLLGPYPKKLLHIAPEKVLESKFRQVPVLDYLSGDLHDPRAMAKIDVTDIQYPDDSFDAILCSHVLEHVANDRQAIGEFYRVLKPNGFAVLMVPIVAKETFEDPTVTDPAERERLFGQQDHVRSYGPDFKDRLERAGFSVMEFRERDIVERHDLVRLGVLNAEGLSEVIFLCRK